MQQRITAFVTREVNLKKPKYGYLDAMALVEPPCVRTQCRQSTAADPELFFARQVTTSDQAASAFNSSFRGARGYPGLGSSVRFGRFSHFASSEPRGQLDGHSSDAARCIFACVCTWSLFRGSPGPSPPVLPGCCLSGCCCRVLGLSVQLQPLRVRAISEAFARHLRRRPKCPRLSRLCLL